MNTLKDQRLWVRVDLRTGYLFWSLDSSRSSVLDNHITSSSMSDVHCDFSKWFSDYLKNAYEFKLLIFSIHISVPTTVPNQTL